MSADQLKKLKIKVNTCKRIAKEVQSYNKEADTQKAKIEALKQKGADASDIKKQEEVLAETNSMIPDSQRRLQTAVDDLGTFMQDLEGKVPEDNEDWKAAVELRASAV